jgi:hypothetical protein
VKAPGPCSQRPPELDRERSVKDLDADRNDRGNMAGMAQGVIPRCLMEVNMKSFVTVVSLLVSCGSALACTCGNPPPCAKVGPNAVIFIGVPLNAPYPSPHDFSKVQPVRFKIEKSFKGLPDGTQFVEVDTLAASSCEAAFTKGVRYVVYAESDSTSSMTFGSLTRWFRRVFHGESFYPGRVFTSQCKGSRQVQDAAEDIRFLEAFVAHRTVMSIQGQVYADTGQGNYQLYDRIQKLLPGSSVSMSRMDGQQYGAVADAKGRFHI